MKKVFILILVMVLILVGVTGYLVFRKKPVTTNNPSGQNNGEKSSVTVSQDKISIKNLAFNPALLDVKVGSTVTWTDEDPMEHTVTSNNFQSQKLSQGQSFSHTFNDVGEFDYFCSIDITL